ncbi:MAG: hypothetical protein QCI82_00090 [Candidatus Thermoplasmatota archaeon]|nr:hypothetical protein [Candidatus Thermoplasmatota archaeon]
MAALTALIISCLLSGCCLLLFFSIVIASIIVNLFKKAMPENDGQKTIGVEDITESVIDGEFKEV